MPWRMSLRTLPAACASAAFAFKIEIRGRRRPALAATTFVVGGHGKVWGTSSGLSRRNVVVLDDGLHQVVRQRCASRLRLRHAGEDDFLGEVGLDAVDEMFHEGDGGEDGPNLLLVVAGDRLHLGQLGPHLVQVVRRRLVLLLFVGEEVLDEPRKLLIPAAAVLVLQSLERRPSDEVAGGRHGEKGGGSTVIAGK